VIVDVLGALHGRAQMGDPGGRAAERGHVKRVDIVRHRRAEQEITRPTARLGNACGDKRLSLHTPRITVQDQTEETTDPPPTNFRGRERRLVVLRAATAVVEGPRHD
jgi:hypothetical protein